jgi:hypothetical protein
LFVVESMYLKRWMYRVRPDQTPELVISGPRLVGVALDPRGDIVVCSADTAFRFTSSPA